MYSKACIYKITFEQSDRIYIGSTNNKVQRKSQHLYKLRRDNHENPKLQNYFNKYGEEQFNFQVIETILDKEDRQYIEEREQAYLDKYFAQEYIESDFNDKRFDDLLLNVSPEVGNERNKWAEERRQKLIERNKNFEWTKERREHMSKVKSGVPNDPEVNKRRSKSLKEYYRPTKKDRKPCPNCGSRDVRKVGTRYYKTLDKKVQRLRCSNCSRNYQAEIK